MSASNRNALCVLIAQSGTLLSFWCPLPCSSSPFIVKTSLDLPLTYISNSSIHTAIPLVYMKLLLLWLMTKAFKLFLLLPILSASHLSSILLHYSQNELVNSSIRISSVQSLSRVRLFATPWTVAYQAPPSMGFSRQ